MVRRNHKRKAKPPKRPRRGNTVEKKPDPVAQMAAFLHTPRPTIEGELERLFYCLVTRGLSQRLLDDAGTLK